MNIKIYCNVNFKKRIEEVRIRKNRHANHALKMNIKKIVTSIIFSQFLILIPNFDL